MSSHPHLERTANLLGAFALLAHGQVEKALQDHLGKGRSAAAAILTIGTRPRGSIEALSRTLGLTHSATVRLVEGLARERMVIKLPGPDRRSSALILSTKGEIRFAGLLQRRRGVLEQFLKKLPPQAYQAVGQALGQMLKQSAGSRQEAQHICRLCEHRLCKPCPVGSTVRDEMKETN
ncbi:MAG: hypothetical protein V3T83_17135 [Acidobacteriota bacterium]